jgi:hypothetical protein
VFVTNQSFVSLHPRTLEVTRVSLRISPHVVHTADTWYDAATDELYFVQIATGKVYAFRIGTKMLRLVATTIEKTISTQNSIGVVYLTDSRHCLLVYAAKQIDLRAPVEAGEPRHGRGASPQSHAAGHHASQYRGLSPADQDDRPDRREQRREQAQRCRLPPLPIESLIDACGEEYPGPPALRVEPGRFPTKFDRRSRHRSVNRLLLSLHDLSGRAYPVHDATIHLGEAMSWLCRAQDAGGDGGVSRSYALRHMRAHGRRGWLASYPETTGYIIPTFLPTPG